MEQGCPGRVVPGPRRSPSSPGRLGERGPGLAPPGRTGNDTSWSEPRPRTGPRQPRAFGEAPASALPRSGGSPAPGAGGNLAGGDAQVGCPRAPAPCGVYFGESSPPPASPPCQISAPASCHPPPGPGDPSPSPLRSHDPSPPRAPLASSLSPAERARLVLPCGLGVFFFGLLVFLLLCLKKGKGRKREELFLRKSCFFIPSPPRFHMYRFPLG